MSVARYHVYVSRAMRFSVDSVSRVSGVISRDQLEELGTFCHSTSKESDADKALAREREREGAGEKARARSIPRRLEMK